MTTCMFCGAQVPEGARFCTSCGAALPVEAAPAQTAFDPVQEPIDVQPEQASQTPLNMGAQQGYQQPAQQPYYGNAADQPPAGAYQQQAQQGAPQPPYGQTNYQQDYQQQNTQPSPTYAMPSQPAAQNDKGSILWGILSFIFPIVGIVLFFVWRNTKPQTAKVAIIGAVVGMVFSLMFNMMTGAI